MRLRNVAVLNPPVRGLGRADAGRLVSFLPLEAIWPAEGFDASREIEFGGEVQSYNPVAEGDILLPKVAPTFARGRVAIAVGLIGGLALATSEVFVVRPYQSSGARFLAYRLRSRDFIDEGVASWTGVAGLKRVSGSFVRNVCLDERAWDRRAEIADFLDRECERIADLRYRAEQLMRLALATHWEMAAQELLAAGPGEHQTIRLKYLVEQPVGGAWGKEVGADEEDVVVARVADFDRHSLRVAEPPTARSVARQVASRLALRTGDLLLEKSGGGERSPVGFVARYEGQPGVIFSNFLARVRPLREVDSLYLKHLFGALYATGRNIPCVRQVTGIQNLDVDAYLSQSVPARSTKRQSALALRFEVRLERAEKLRAACGRLDARLTDYRDALITEAVSGQLDVTRLSDAQLDESAHAAAEGEAPEVLAG